MHDSQPTTPGTAVPSSPADTASGTAVLADLDDLRLALELADAADALTLPRFRAQDFRVESKPDLTPVTDADRACEELLRTRLSAARPQDSFLGEEFGEHGAADRRWIVDPIDGTKNFVRGVPVYATLIALYDGEVPHIGVVSAPALGMRWYAAAGHGAYRQLTGHLASTSGTANGASTSGTVNGASTSGTADAPAPARLAVSGVSRLADASLSYSSLSGWAAHRDRDRFLALTDAVWRTRAYGDFWSYMMVAEGSVDAACEPELALYDMAALVPIVIEAGGTFTDLTGRPGPFGAHALATNGHLHKEILTYV